MSNPLPVEITLHSKSHNLAITFDDGAHFELPCEYLRVYSPSAEVIGHHNKTPTLQVGKEEVNIVDIQQVGTYAIKIFFDDKHKSGLYTWHYLYDLGTHREEYWADYLQRLAAAGHKRKEHTV